jgi:hypothetical protein
MKLFNFANNKRVPNQRKLGRTGGAIGGTFGLGFTVDEYNLYSQIKDYRTDLLNGTNWRGIPANSGYSLSYMQFLNVISKYSTAIFNDYCYRGYAVFAKIDGQIFYVSRLNYTRNLNDDKIVIHGYPGVEAWAFDEPNFFCGELTTYQKCEPYQKLYNIALSCQRNGMYKSGFITIMSPKTPGQSNAIKTLRDDEVEQIEKDLSENHGVATSEQNNFMILRYDMNVSTVSFDAGKMGILETKKLCEEYVCSKLGVPHILLPSEGQTYANFEEANKILYENHSKYCEYFCKFAKRELGFEIDYKTIAEAGKGIV